MFVPQISVVIPTLQKNKELLINLLNTLEKDSCVKEIIVIDNSTKGLDFESPKTRIIIPQENLFVNPSWNLGVKEAKNEIVALLNDDIIIPEDFCARIAEKMTPDMGCVGYGTDNILESKEMTAPPQKTELKLEPTKARCLYWGIAIFFYKSSYYEIPDELKIYCGDDWIFTRNQCNKRQNYIVCGQDIYHYGSLSSNDKGLNPIGKRDTRLFRKLTYKWWQHILNIEPLFRGVRIILFGIKMSFHFNEKH